MASPGTRAYNGGLEAKPPAGIDPWGRAPGGWSGGEAPPPEADEVFVFETLIFNASAKVLHEVTYCLNYFFFFAHVYEFTVRICSLAFAYIIPTEDRRSLVFCLCFFVS